MTDINPSIQACFDNARDLRRAAKRVLASEQLPNIAFHLAILALEEIGKATLIGTRGIAVSLGDEPVFVNDKLDDHIFKLFWALWTPSFARGRVEQKEFEGLRGLARSMHDERLSAMYVATDAGVTGVPLQQVSPERARQIIGLAEARLGMETSRDWKSLDLGAGSVTRWFFEAANDPEKRKPHLRARISRQAGGAWPDPRLDELAERVVRPVRSRGPRPFAARTRAHRALRRRSRRAEIRSCHPALLAGPIGGQPRHQIVERASHLDQASHGQ